MTKQSVYQFKITLLGIKPSIWRRIQVPSSYSFWDLHVAIQNAMGWLDCHLHEFTVRNPISGEEESIGIPENEDSYDSSLPGWKLKIKRYVGINSKMRYIYDFGDHWEHEIKFEGEHLRLKEIEYPICLGGKRACPPEDVGGVFGYEHLLEVMNDPNDEEYKNMLTWIGDSFDAEEFDATQVLFHDPAEHRESRLMEL